MGGMPVGPQVHANVEGWCTLEVQRSKEPFAKICILSCQYTKEYNLGYIHTAMPTGKPTHHRISLGLIAWNAPRPIFEEGGS